MKRYLIIIKGKRGVSLSCIEGYVKELLWKYKLELETLRVLKEGETKE